MVLWLSRGSEILLPPLYCIWESAKKLKYSWNLPFQNTRLVQALRSEIWAVQLKKKKVVGMLPDMPPSSMLPQTFQIKHFSVSSIFRMYRYPISFCTEHRHRACIIPPHLQNFQENKETRKEGMESKLWKCTWIMYPGSLFTEWICVQAALLTVGHRHRQKKKRFNPFQTEGWGLFDVPGVTRCLVLRNVKSVKKHKQAHVLILVKIKFRTGRNCLREKSNPLFCENVYVKLSAWFKKPEQNPHL